VDRSPHKAKLKMSYLAFYDTPHTVTSSKTSDITSGTAGKMLSTSLL